MIKNRLIIFFSLLIFSASVFPAGMTIPTVKVMGKFYPITSPTVESAIAIGGVAGSVMGVQGLLAVGMLEVGVAVGGFIVEEAVNSLGGSEPYQSVAVPLSSSHALPLPQNPAFPQTVSKITAYNSLDSNCPKNFDGSYHWFDAPSLAAVQSAYVDFGNTAPPNGVISNCQIWVPPATKLVLDSRSVNGVFSQVPAGVLAVTPVYYPAGPYFGLVTHCPNGYISSGATTCSLSDSRAAINDGRKDFKRTGSAFSAYAGDLGGSGLDNSLATVATSNDSVKLQGLSDSGSPLSWTITNRPDGGSTFTQIAGLTDGVGNTYNQTSTFQISPSNVVESKSVSSSGTGSATGSSSAPTIFPSDYARQGEAVIAANSVSTAVDRVHADLSTNATPLDPVVPLAADMPFFGNTFDSLTAWRLPFHNSVCPQPSVDLSTIFGAGSVYTLTSHCTLMNNNFQSLRSSMTVVFLILALFIVLRA